MNFKTQESEQKLRGAYYTPLDIATFIAKWVSVGYTRSILEPSCGDGVFFDALASVIENPFELTAIELDSEEARKARTRARELSVESEVLACDFLEWAVQELHRGNRAFDAVVGNPPFIRYQYLAEGFQHQAAKIFEHLGCRFTKHTNAWVPFVLAAVALLRPGGRLGMVIPAEVIHVTHAQSLRTFLGLTCSRLVIVDPAKLWFTNTLQGAVVLLAEKRKTSREQFDGVGIVSVQNREFTNTDPETLFRSVSTINGRTIAGKWTNALLDGATREVLESVQSLPSIQKFANVAKVDVGIVTGANKFFLVPDETIDSYSLEDHAYPMFGRSEHCPGIVYDYHQHQTNARNGKPTNFLWFKNPKDIERRSVQEYIRLGEDQEYHKRYKCRIRSPWYAVPSVYATEIGMLKRSHHAPRLILNKVRAFTTDTVYRVTTQSIVPEMLVASFLNPLTALSAELEGRHYGGGVLELVPSEIERLLIPLPQSHNTNIQSLDDFVRKDCVENVLEEHGIPLLEKSGMNREASERLLHAWLLLRNRRQRTPVSQHDRN